MSQPTQTAQDKRGVLEVSDDLNIRIRRVTNDAKECARIQNAVTKALEAGTARLNQVDPKNLRKLADSIGRDILRQSNALNRSADKIAETLILIETDLQRWLVLNQDPHKVLEALASLSTVADSWAASHNRTRDLAAIRMTTLWTEGFEGYALAAEKFSTMYRKASRFATSVLESRD